MSQTNTGIVIGTCACPHVHIIITDASGAEIARHSCSAADAVNLQAALAVAVDDVKAKNAARLGRVN